jgi:starch synthase
MNIVVIAAEVAPWAKTGGLGDVCGALPKALAARGHRVMTVCPRYKDYPDAWDTGVRAQIFLFGMAHEVRYYHSLRDGVHHLFVDHPSFHRPGIYGDSTGAYGDNLFRFALLSRAALEAPLRVPLEGSVFGEEVVFHANDWHTALVPVYLDAIYRTAGRFPRAGTVLGLHNLGHHGSSAAHDFAGLDLSTRWWPTLDFHGNVNLLKAGIVSAKRLVAVSPTYARQITQDHGFGLEGLLHWRRHELVGILNGIDDTWNPATDPHIAARYSPEDLSGKAACKAAIQQELRLPVRPDVPVLGLVARLDYQKGIDLVRAITPALMRHDVQLVVLGSGSKEYAEFFQHAAQRWPNRVGVHIGFSEPLAHRIEAGADIFLMPSRFEPCGLNQLYSLKYGTVPVVHATGGLADTVENFDPYRDRGNGWAFREFSAEAFLEATSWAVNTFLRHPATWKAIQLRGMREDHSWSRAAAAYEAVYTASLEG